MSRPDTLHDLAALIRSPLGGEPSPVTDPTRSAAPPRRVPRSPPVQAETTPLPAPASSFETRRLKAIGSERLELVTTWQERAFLALLFGFALALAAIGIDRLDGEPLVLALAAMPLDAPIGAVPVSAASTPSAALPMSAAVVLAAVAALLARAGGRTVLDARTRRFSRSGGALHSRRRVSEQIDFDELVGVQRLACRIADERARWTIHQVNLVAKDGARVHLCSHVDEALARRTAETVARFVGVAMLPPASC